MAKFYGIIAFAMTEQAKPGVWKERIVERNYYGELVRNTKHYQNSGEVNDNLVISNQISVVSDPFANENFHAMRYVVFMGTKWKIESVEVSYPRLILSIGGVYNGGEKD